jgi:hypothetical protein
VDSYGAPGKSGASLLSGRIANEDETMPILRWPGVRQRITAERKAVITFPLLPDAASPNRDSERLRPTPLFAE